MKLIKRIITIILLAISASLLLLVISTAVDFVIGTKRLEKITNTVITREGSPDVLAYVARPTGSGTYPAVIMIHEFWGLNQDITGKADALTQEGYVVVAPDTFRGNTTGWVPRAIIHILTHPAEQVNQDLDSVYAWLASQPDVDPERVAVMGFCYGGRAALSYSLHNSALAATAIFYGSPETDPAVLQNLPGPVLGIFGGADQSIPLERVEAFRAALDQVGIPNQISVYEGQPHAFVTTVEAIRAGGPQGEAWNELLVFLKTYLSNPPTTNRGNVEVSLDHPSEWRYYFMLALEHVIGSANRH